MAVARERLGSSFSPDGRINRLGIVPPQETKEHLDKRPMLVVAHAPYIFDGVEGGAVAGVQAVQ